MSNDTYNIPLFISIFCLIKIFLHQYGLQKHEICYEEQYKINYFPDLYLNPFRGNIELHDEIEEEKDVSGKNVKKKEKITE